MKNEGDTNGYHRTLAHDTLDFPVFNDHDGIDSAINADNEVDSSDDDDDTLSFNSTQTDRTWLIESNQVNDSFIDNLNLRFKHAPRLC